MSALFLLSSLAILSVAAVGWTGPHLWPVSSTPATSASSTASVCYSFTYNSPGKVKKRRAIGFESIISAKDPSIVCDNSSITELQPSEDSIMNGKRALMFLNAIQPTPTSTSTSFIVFQHILPTFNKNGTGRMEMLIP